MEGTSNMPNMGSPDHFQPDTCLTLFKNGEEGSDVSRSGSEIPDEKSSKRTKCYRHTSEQIQELESFFKGCPHPDEKQKIELSKKLGLEIKQVKFWFQNRRTHLKAQMERNERDVLKLEYERLIKEAAALKEFIGKPLCKGCGSSVFGEITMEEQLVRMENARLKKELTKAYGMLQNLMAKPPSVMANSFSQLKLGNVQLDLSVGRSDFNVGLALGGSNPVRGVRPDNGIALASSSSSSSSSESRDSMYVKSGMAAMNELLILADNYSPFWLGNLDGKGVAFDEEGYRNKFNYYEATPSGFVTEATRANGVVRNASLELMNMMMHPDRWAEMFPCMIGRVSIIENLCRGVDGTHDGELLMMTAELVYPSPLVPLRHIRFIRYCKLHPDGTWAIVNVSVDPIREDYTDVGRRCRYLPSGCTVKDLPNGYSMVTFVEHAEYDESTVHSLFRPLMRSGLCYGAERWLATLQRRCECSFTAAIRPPGISIKAWESILTLTKRVVNSFCFGICASSLRRWEKLKVGNMAPEMQAMTRVNLSDVGEYLGIILSLATSVWLPISRQTLFAFLRNPQFRAQWDTLSYDGPMQEAVRITNSPIFDDRTSILFPPANTDKNVNMVILQESWADKVTSSVIYTGVDTASMTAMMEGEDSDMVEILPSGFVIADSILEPTDSKGAEPRHGSLLTLGFQILISNEPTAKIAERSIESMSRLMNTRIGKIEAALLGDQNHG